MQKLIPSSGQYPVSPMEAPPPAGPARAKKSLENYASSYLGAYLNTVKKEHPDHLPPLARNEAFEVEVSLMPNGCFALVFEKADKQRIEVKERDWASVEGKVMSGVTHLVAVYPHEGVTVADAIARGKRDAVRDIRSLEDSNLGKAITQLERILTELTKVEHGNASIAQLGELELKKLEPVKDAVLAAGPEMDMLAVIDAMKNCPAGGSSVSVEVKGKELLEKIVSDLGDLSDLIRRVEAQDEKLDEVQKSLKKVLTEYNQTIDERISKGLAVILSSSDKKIDKGLAALGDIKRGVAPAQPAEPPAELTARITKMDKAVQALHIQLQEVASKRIPSVELPKDLEMRLDSLEKGSQAIEMQVLDKLSAMEQRQLKDKEERDRREQEQRPEPLPDVTSRIEELKVTVGRLGEAAAVIAEMKDNIQKLNQRVARIEEVLTKAQVAPRQRTLKAKEADSAPQTPPQGPGS